MSASLFTVDVYSIDDNILLSYMCVLFSIVVVDVSCEYLNCFRILICILCCLYTVSVNELRFISFKNK
jgi:hypothetical protein